MMPTFVETYRTDPRDGWPAGEWDNEPDKAVWVDETTGLDCMVRRGGGGAWCGYVAVPLSHPWHGLHYGRCGDAGCTETWCEHSGGPASTEVHGGLTFANGCRESSDPAVGICHIPQPGRPGDVWWFGFDCSHAWDLRPEYGRAFHDEVYRTMHYVVAETEGLARQIAARTNDLT